MTNLHRKLKQPLHHLAEDELEWLISEADHNTEICVLWAEKIVMFASFMRNKTSSYLKRHYGGKRQIVFFGLHQLLTWYASRQHGQGLLDHRIVNALCWLENAYRFGKEERYITDEIISTLLQQQLSCYMHLRPYCQPRNLSGFEFRPVMPSRREEKIVILSPQSRSLYKLCVLDMCNKLKIPVAGVFVRKMTIKRAVSEASQYGYWPFLKKVWSNLVLNKFYSNTQVNTLKECVDILNIPNYDLRKMCDDQNVYYLTVNDFEEAVGFFESEEPSIAAFTGGGLTRENILERFSVGMINVHLGVLPNYKGMGIVEAALLEGKIEEVGLTSHFMDTKIDTGPIIRTQPIHCDKKLSIDQIYQSLLAYTPVMMIDAVLRLRAGENPVNQVQSGRQYYALH